MVIDTYLILGKALECSQELHWSIKVALVDSFWFHDPTQPGKFAQFEVPEMISLLLSGLKSRQTDVGYHLRVTYCMFIQIFCGGYSCSSQELKLNRKFNCFSSVAACIVLSGSMKVGSQEGVFHVRSSLTTFNLNLFSSPSSVSKESIYSANEQKEN